VEHLLSAIVGVGLDDVLIEPFGPEIPIMDGSAMPFAARILEIGLAEKDEPKRCFSLSAPVCVDIEGSSITAVPSDRARITYIIDYPGTGIGTEMKDVILDGETYINEIAPARTFVLQSEVDALRSSGLGLGGDFENVTIIGADGPLNRVGYRVERECAAHKTLDMLGDLALLGIVPKARYTCVRGGHKLHLKLMDRLIRMVRQAADRGR
jgi:UDP-3-O-[3-hydroxymyristoyl] N-acetylglucosamine deacetylase